MRQPLVTPPSAGSRPSAAFGRSTTRRRHDDNDETLVSLFDGLHPLAAPRFARWQERGTDGSQAAVSSPAAACDPSVPHSCQRRPRPTSPPTGESRGYWRVAVPLAARRGAVAGSAFLTSLSSSRRVVPGRKAGARRRRRGHDRSVTANTTPSVSMKKARGESRHVPNPHTAANIDIQGVSPAEVAACQLLKSAGERT